MEWDVLAGPMYSLTLTLMLAYPTPGGDGMVAGEVAGDVAEGVGSAGAGLHLIGTLVVEDGKSIIQIFLKEVIDMWPWYRCWHPWRWHGHWWATPYAWPWAPIPKEEEEIAMLEEQARMLESNLDSVRKRLEELKK